MNDLVDKRTRAWAALAVIAGVVLFLGIEIWEEPRASVFEWVLELLKTAPLVASGVGVAVLFRLVRQQRDDHLQVLRNLEIARLQGQRWRTESRSLLNGLGQAIDTQFGQWGLTDAEREVALLLLKGLSTKEIGAVRGGSERTVREHARSVYAKAGLTGRAALSAFFLEDLLAPIEEPGARGDERKGA